MKNTISFLTAALLSLLVLTSCGSKSNETEPKIDKYSGKEAKIGIQIWMVENLNVDHFRNGDPIPEAKTAEEWKKAGEKQQPAWCYYDNDPKNGEKYGKLYNWYAVNDPRGLAPKGWHIPTDDEWSVLTNYLGGEEIAFEKIKSKSGWENGGNGKNSCGFSGMPGGYRDGSGTFDSIGRTGYWWCSTEVNTSIADGRSLSNYLGAVTRELCSKDEGLTVRCLKD